MVKKKINNKEIIDVGAEGESLEVNPTEIEGIRAGLDLVNVTDARLFSKIDLGLDAKRVITDKFGDVIAEVDDYETQRKYVLMALELRGLVKTKAAVMGIKDGDREIVVAWATGEKNG